MGQLCWPISLSRLSVATRGDAEDPRFKTRTFLRREPVDVAWECRYLPNVCCPDQLRHETFQTDGATTSGGMPNLNASRYPANGAGSTPRSAITATRLLQAMFALTAGD